MVDILRHLGRRYIRSVDILFLIELLLFKIAWKKGLINTFLFPRHCFGVRLDKEAVVKGFSYFLLHLVLQRPGEQINVLFLGPTVLTLPLYILVHHRSFVRARLFLQVILPIA